MFSFKNRFYFILFFTKKDKYPNLFEYLTILSFFLYVKYIDIKRETPKYTGSEQGDNKSKTKIARI